MRVEGERVGGKSGVGGEGRGEGRWEVMGRGEGAWENKECGVDEERLGRMMSSGVMSSG